MKTSIVLAAVAAGLLATPAFAQDSGYVQLNLGANVASDVEAEFGSAALPTPFEFDADMDTGVFASIAGGADAGNNFSFEGEFVFLNADIDTSEADAIVGPLNASTKSYGGLVNLIYNFKTDSFSPYVGAGVGYGEAGYEMDGEFEDDAGVIWQLKAGAVFPISENLSIDAGYRYVSLPAFEVSEGTESIEVDSSAHILSVGARFAF